MRNFFLILGGVVVWGGLVMVSLVGPLYTNIAAVGIMMLGTSLALNRWKFPGPWASSRKLIFQSGLATLTASGVMFHFVSGRHGTAIGFACIVLVGYWIGREVYQRTPWDQFRNWNQ